MTVERTKPSLLDLPASLKADAERSAERDGVSLNQFNSVALAEKIGAQDAAAFFERRGAGGDLARAIAMLRGSPDVPPAEGDEIGS
ncbi:MAG: hypothetical protein AAF713_21215 [Pseudomonadota bacterium]